MSVLVRSSLRSSPVPEPKSSKTVPMLLRALLCQPQLARDPPLPFSLLTLGSHLKMQAGTQSVGEEPDSHAERARELNPAK